MKIVLPLLILSLTTMTATAARFQSKVDSIDLGSGKVPHLIKLENGRVVFLDGEDKDQLSLFQDSLSHKDTLEIEVNNKNSLESVLTVDMSGDETADREGNALVYDPSVISSSQASTAFRNMRRDYQNDSQCYNRAHIWAYEEFKRTGLKSMKLFLFFTNRYIRNYRYHWWFHVSPMAMVSEGSSSVERVLDRRYTSGPRYVKNWTDIFIYSRRACPKVSRYSDYRNNQEKEDCYLIPVSMYYWQPRDIANNVNKTQFYNSEINHAYWEAF